MFRFVSGMKRYFQLYIFMLLFSPGVMAQQWLTFNHITKGDGNGLISNIIYCTHQDEKGYIWAGTANGLQRFDGSRFMHFSYSKPNPGELPLSSVTDITSWKKDFLWLQLATEKKVGLFNTRRFTFTEVPLHTKRTLPQKSFLMRLYKDSRNNVFLFIWKYGVLHYNESSNSFEEDNFFKLPPGWVPTNFFFEDNRSSRMLLPCPDSGLAIFDYNHEKLYTSANNPLQLPMLQNKGIQKGISEVYIDSRRRHWMFLWNSGHDYHCFDEKGKELQDTAGIRDNKEYAELRYFFESKNRVLWMYGANCLYSYDSAAQRMHFYQQRGNEFSAIKYQLIHHMMEDKDGIIWISTDNGIYYTSSAAGKMDVVNMYITKDKNNLEITDLVELKGGQFWLSTWGEAIITFTADFKKYDAGIYENMPAMDKASSIMYRQVWSLHQDSKGKVWVGCQGGKYMLHDTATHRTSFNVLKEAEGSTIRYISEDRNGQTWIGTQSGHIIRYDGKSFVVLHKLGVVIRKIMPDNEGLLWVATESQGAICLNADGSIRKRYTNSGQRGQLFSSSVIDMDQLNDSIIACAAGALNFINKRTGEVQWVTFENGLPGNSVQRIRKDQKGYLWLNTLDGLCRYNPINHAVTLYGKKDGIEFDKFTTQTDYLCRAGYVMFAGGSHLLFFKPGLFESAGLPPDVVITEFKLHDQYLLLDSLLSTPEINFKSDQNSFTMGFSALSFLQREKLAYYYRMKGIGDEWIKADRLQTVSYSLLPPGKYEFQVYCQNIDGTRSKNITSIFIHIRPPFWRTAWFLSVLLTMVALVAYTMHQLRIRRLLAVEKIRNRVARDLHDDMGSTLSTINILSSMAKAKLNSDVQKTGEYINKISDNSQRMMEAMDDIVWAIKPANDSMQKIVARMREFATNVFEAKDIELEFSADEAVYDVQLDMEARRDLFLVFKEAVNNAAKYSKCSRASVVILLQHKKLLLQVKDNGRGFDVTAVDAGNGLGNMQKRADALRALFKIESKKDQGTTVSLSVPVN